MKRSPLIIFLLFLLSAVLLLAACGSSDPADTTAPVTTAPATSAPATAVPTTAPATSASPASTAPVTTAPVTSAPAPLTATYTVEYYLQNVTGSGYTRVDEATEQPSGVSGAPVTAEEKAFPHFTLDREASELEGMIKSDGSLVLRVYYKRATYAIGAEAAEHGTVTGGGTYRYGAAVSLTATPAPGYELLGWYDGATLLSAEPTYTLTAESARSITARFFFDEAAFAPFTYTLDATACVITGLADTATPATRVVIPRAATAIGERAFENCVYLTEIAFAEGSRCTSIGAGAFFGCSGLLSLTIPASVTSIGERLFTYCDKVAVYCEVGAKPTGWDLYWNATGCHVIWSCKTHEVSSGGAIFTVIDGIRYALWNNGEATVAGQLYTLETAAIPTEVTYKNKTYPVKGIGYCAFQYCFELTEVSIPASVSSIGENAFWQCEALARITVPASVTSIGRYAFEGCEMLTVYCEATEQPTGWDSAWNPSSCPVVWSCKDQ